MVDTDETQQTSRREWIRNWLEICAIILVVLAIGVRAYGTQLGNERVKLTDALSYAQSRLDACIPTTASVSEQDARCGSLQISVDEAKQALQTFESSPTRQLVMGLALNERVSENEENR